MKKEIKSMLGKTAKIACVTSVAAGAIAVMTSGFALKAISEGGKYMANAVKRIVTEDTAATKEGAVTDEEFTVPESAPSEDAI